MPVQELDPTGAKILDGAVRVLGDFGFKRATVELVAKYAGVSHMTIYRRWPSKNDLLKTAVITEFTTLLDAGFTTSAGDTGGATNATFAEMTLAAFSDIVWAVQNHPLVLRELNADSGEQSPLLSSTSSAVMEATVPLVAQRLRDLSSTTADAPAHLDSVADVFVRLAHSLVVVKRPDQPLVTRAEVVDYARECFGPYLQALTGLASVPVSAAVVELDQHRSSRNWHRPHLQIAAASLVGVLTLGAGLTAVLNGAIALPFITPAGISRPTTPTTPANTPPGPGQDSPRVTAVSQLPAPAVQPPFPVVPPSAAQPAAELSPNTQIDMNQRPASAVGSIGGNSANDDLPADKPVATPLAPRPLGPAPGPRPPGPEPKPPGPGPGPGPGPNPPGPKPPGPGPGPGPKPPGPGPQQPGPKPPGPGPQANQQSGPSN